MTEVAILVASALLLLAYLVDIAGRRYRLPSVVLLIATGIALRQVLDSTGVELHWIAPVVPVLGTIGLILIMPPTAAATSSSPRWAFARRASTDR